GDGNAFRSTFPFPVSGSFSITTHTPGTMYSGNRCFRYSLNCFSLPPPSSLHSFFHTTYPTNLFSPISSSLITTTHSFPPPCSGSTASTSPNSIRCPLTFTCRSFRPINSNSPPGFHLTRSPVRYILAPALPLNASGTNFSAVHPPCFTY